MPGTCAFVPAEEHATVERRLAAVCYHGRTMAKPKARAGRTEKISVSLDRADVAIMRKRAKKLYDGNLSAVIAEGLRRVREEEGREALVVWLGTAGDTTREEREAIIAEWAAKPAGRKTRGRPAA